MRRHDLDVFSLVTGLVFVAVAAGHLLDESSQMDFDGRWVLPLVLVAVGVAGLAGLVRGREPRPAGAKADAAADRATDGSGADDGTDETLVLPREETEEH